MPRLIGRESFVGFVVHRLICIINCIWQENIWMILPLYVIYFIMRNNKDIHISSRWHSVEACSWLLRQPRNQNHDRELSIVFEQPENETERSLGLPHPLQLAMSTNAKRPRRIFLVFIQADFHINPSCILKQQIHCLP